MSRDWIEAECLRLAKNVAGGSDWCCDETRIAGQNPHRQATTTEAKGWPAGNATAEVNPCGSDCAARVSPRMPSRRLFRRPGRSSGAHEDRKRETFEPVTLGHIRRHGVRNLL